MNLIRDIFYSSGLIRYFSKRRILIIEKLLGINIIDTINPTFKNILEVGCGKGKDLIQFIMEDDINITGIDIQDRGLKNSNINLLIKDCESIEFDDNYFDCTFSIGLLEHISPINKLNKVIDEINRVSKSYIIIVPSVSTIIEPHTGSLFWPIRSNKNKKDYNLNYFNDETWLKFDGFKDAKSFRLNHFPFLLTNLVIYKIS